MKTGFHSHFYAIFQDFYAAQLKQQICYTFTLLISYMILMHLKWQSSSSFPNLMVQMLVFPFSTGPWPRLKKGRKIPVLF